LIRTIRQLVETAKNLVSDREVLVQDVDTGKTMIIENVSRMNSDTEPDDVRYVLNCKKAGNGSMAFNTFDIDDAQK
jgi:hypothetical protein